jgi:threonine dehydrogenase-like Zn-dependent dehydrogenase
MPMAKCAKRLSFRVANCTLLPTAVFDATGNPKSMMGAFEYSAHGGRLIFVGLFPGDITFNDPNFHRRELTVLSSRNARPEDFTRIIDLVEGCRIDNSRAKAFLPLN